MLLDVDFYLTAGDTAPSLVSILKDENGDPIAFGATDNVYLTMRRFGGGAYAFNNSPGVLSTGTPGQAMFAWNATGTSLYGTYEAQWRVVFASGEQTRFPNDQSYLIVEVSKSL